MTTRYINIKRSNKIQLADPVWLSCNFLKTPLKMIRVAMCCNSLCLTIYNKQYIVPFSETVCFFKISTFKRQT